MFFSVNRIKICVALIVIIALLQMISLFKIFDFQYLIALCGMLIVFLGIKIMSNNFRKMVRVFLFLGILLNVYTQQSLAAWVNGINYMLNIAAILVIMQLFVIPIKIGNYAAHFNHLLLKVFDNERTIYFFFLSNCKHVFYLPAFRHDPSHDFFIGRTVKKNSRRL